MTGGSMDTFEPIFLQDMSPMLEHDLFLLVHPPQASHSSQSSSHSSQSSSQSSSHSSKGKKLTREMRRLLNSWETTNTLQHISDLLVKGMTNRITKIRVVFFNPNPNPNLQEEQEEEEEEQEEEEMKERKEMKVRSILVGMTLSPLHSGRVLDKGPSAEDVSR
jgi:hypothetical protein